eukprot:m.707065 g.707065  ORF g.707065 m.707065 type:complete len:900 (+) comp22935_c0_seq24:137-2836(+)
MVKPSGSNASRTNAWEVADSNPFVTDASVDTHSRGNGANYTRNRANTGDGRSDSNPFIKTVVLERPTNECSFGFTVATFDDGRKYVSRVSQDGLADQSDITPGIEILTMDGAVVKEFSNEEFTQYFSNRLKVTLMVDMEMKDDVLQTLSEHMRGSQQSSGPQRRSKFSRFSIGRKRSKKSTPEPPAAAQSAPGPGSTALTRDAAVALHDQNAQLSAKLHDAERRAAAAEAAAAAAHVVPGSTSDEGHERVSISPDAAILSRASSESATEARGNDEVGSIRDRDNDSNPPGSATHSDPTEPYMPESVGSRVHLFPPERDPVLVDTTASAHRLTPVHRSPGRSPTSPLWSSYTRYQPSRASTSLAPTSILPAVHRVERAHKRLSWASMLLDRVAQHMDEQTMTADDDSTDDDGDVVEIDGVPLRNPVIALDTGFDSMMLEPGFPRGPSTVGPGTVGESPGVPPPSTTQTHSTPRATHQQPVPLSASMIQHVTHDDARDGDFGASSTTSDDSASAPATGTDHAPGTEGDHAHARVAGSSTTPPPAPPSDAAPGSSAAHDHDDSDAAGTLNDAQADEPPPADVDRMGVDNADAESGVNNAEADVLPVGAQEPEGDGDDANGSSGDDTSSAASGSDMEAAASEQAVPSARDLSMSDLQTSGVDVADSSTEESSDEHDEQRSGEHPDENDGQSNEDCRTEHSSSGDHNEGNPDENSPEGSGNHREAHREEDSSGESDDNAPPPPPDAASFSPFRRASSVTSNIHFTPTGSRKSATSSTPDASAAASSSPPHTKERGTPTLNAAASDAAANASCTNSVLFVAMYAMEGDEDDGRLSFSAGDYLLVVTAFDESGKCQAMVPSTGDMGSALITYIRPANEEEKQEYDRRLSLTTTAAHNDDDDGFEFD